LTALVGFKDHAGLTAALKRTPEILDFVNLAEKQFDLKRDFVGPNSQENRRLLIRALITNAIEKKADLKRAIEKASGRIRRSHRAPSDVEQLFLSLEKKYPGDVGLFFIFLLNLVKLDAGQAILLEPGIPHAYLKGNIIECMAESDNVVRVGLTPKYTDAAALLDILDFRSEIRWVSMVEIYPGCTTYQTPIEEFQISTCRLVPNQIRPENHPCAPEIILISEGSALISWDEKGIQQEEIYHKGQSFLIPANLDRFHIRARDGTVLFRATVH